MRICEVSKAGPKRGRVDVKNRFILLKKVRYGEADLIIQALSPQGGRSSFMARGALKSKKRFGGGVLEPGHFVLLTYQSVPSGSNRLQILKEASLIEDFKGLREDYDRLDFALKALEIVGKVSQEGDSNSEFLFNIIGHTLRALESSDDIEPIRFQFFLKLLLQQGVLTVEPWMEGFLKEPLSQHAVLRELAQRESMRRPGLELLVHDYIKNAGL